MQRLPWRRLVTLSESPESDGEAATRENHPRKKGNRLKTVPLLVSHIDVYEQWVTCGEVGWDDTAAEVQIAEAGDGWVEKHIGHGHICLYTEPVSADVRTRPLTCSRDWLPNSTGADGINPDRMNLRIKPGGGVRCPFSKITWSTCSGHTSRPPRATLGGWLRRHTDVEIR